MASLSHLIDAAEREGRLNVRTEELARQLSGASEAALRLSLDRLRRRGRIVRASRGSGHWVIVPLQDAPAGAPPLEVWLHDYLANTLRLPYYVGLLSAAEAHGASPYAVMVTQIVVPKPRRPVRVGRHQLVFLGRSGIEHVPVQWYESASGRFKVSTPEFTALELVQRQDVVGGPGRVFEVLQALAPAMSFDRLPAALDVSKEIPAAQRLGMFLSLGGHKPGCDVVAHWLAHHRTRIIPLSPGQAAQGKVDPHFKVIVPPDFRPANA